MQDQRRKYTETPGGEKASARPRSALARGGSPAAPGKRSVFPKRVNAPTIISDYFAVYRFCVKNHYLFGGRVSANVSDGTSSAQPQAQSSRKKSQNVKSYPV